MNCKAPGDPRPLKSPLLYAVHTQGGNRASLSLMLTDSVSVSVLDYLYWIFSVWSLFLL